MTGGLGNQMFIYAFYMKMKRLFPNTRIDLSDMMHYHVHNGYELHRIFQQLPEDEFCMPQKTKKVIEFLFFKTILERKQDLTTLRAFFKRRLWPLVYFKGFYQDERYFKDIEDEVRGAFAFNTALCNEKTQRMLPDRGRRRCRVAPRAPWRLSPALRLAQHGMRVPVAILSRRCAPA